MSGSQNHDGAADFDMQGFIGALVGRALGGFVGNRLGGSTGRIIGRAAGSFGGGLLPFSAGPTQQAQAQSMQDQPSDLEMQGFLSVLRRIGRGVSKGVDIGHSLGLFEAGPGQQGQGQSQATQEQPSDLEMQGFLSVLRRIGRGVSKGVDIGHSLGLFEAGPGQQGQSQATQDQPSDLEMQGFLSVLRRIGRGVSKGVDIGHSLGLFEAGPGQQGQDQSQATQEQPSDLEMQGFLSVLRRIGRGVSKGVDIGHSLGLFEAGPGQQGQGQSQATQEQPSDLEMQGFLSVLRRIGRGVSKGVDIGHSLGLFEAGPGQQGQGQSQATQEQPSDLEMQGFLSVLRRIGRGVSKGVDIGHSLGLFEAGPGQQGQGQSQATQEQPSDLEMQGFLSVLRRLNGSQQQTMH